MENNGYNKDNITSINKIKQQQLKKLFSFELQPPQIIQTPQNLIWLNRIYLHLKILQISIKQMKYYVLNKFYWKVTSLKLALINLISNQTTSINQCLSKILFVQTFITKNTCTDTLSIRKGSFIFLLISSIQLNFLFPLLLFDNNRTYFKLMVLRGIKQIRHLIPIFQITIQNRNHIIFFLMSVRPTFRISKLTSISVKTKRLHSEGNKNTSENNIIQLEAEVPSPTLRGWSPPSTIAVRKTILKLKQQKSMRKNKITDTKQYTITEAPEKSLPSAPSFEAKSASLKEETNFTLIPVPVQEDYQGNSYECRKDCIIIFPRRGQFRKYSEATTPNQDISQWMKFDSALYNDIQKVLQELQSLLGKSQSISTLRRYIDIISKGALDDYHNIMKSQEKRKVAEMFIRCERSLVMLVAMNQVTQKIQINYNIISSLLKCCLDNRILILSLLKKQMNKKDTPMDIPSFTNSHEVVKNANMQVRNFQIIKTNNDIIFNLIQKLTAERNYFNDYLKRLLRDQSLEIYKYFQRLLDQFSFFLHANSLEDKAPFLAVAPNPYLPPSHKYTLVIDIIAVLFDEESSCFRPQSQSFIQDMSKYYEIVSYSAKMPKEMEALIRFLDRKNNIKHKLYRQHFIKTKQGFKKDLARLGRPLTQILLVDIQQCEQNPYNTFILNKWVGNAQDKSLEQITYFLSSLPIKNINIQQAIKKHKQEELKKKEKPRRYSYWNNNNS